MYLSKRMSTVKSSINTDYFVWLITFLVLTTLILIILVIVILICSSYRRKQKLLLNASVYNGDRDIFVIDKGGSNDLKIVNGNCVTNPKDSKQNSNKTSQKTKNHCCLSCIKSKTETTTNNSEEEFILIDGDGKIMNIEIRDKDLEDEDVIQLNGTIPNGKHEHENGRLSHIDRELPPIPLINPKSECVAVETELSLKYGCAEKQESIDSTCQTTSSDDNTLSRPQSMSVKESPVNLNKFGSVTIASDGAGCCCGGPLSRADVLSADDLSSTDYDPTYAAIRRTKVSCPLCGAPSVYTPVNSNRNSNLSLQLNSCLASPIRCPNNSALDHDPLNNSTYASIAKLPKESSNKSTNRDQEQKSGCSTIRRQRSISHGDIIAAGSSVKCNKMQQSEIVCDSLKIDDEKDQNEAVLPSVVSKIPLNYMSLWSLIASNRNSPHNMFPIIPERAYGQSVVDLVEKLRASDDCDPYNAIHMMTESNFERSLTQPLLFGSNSFKRRGSLTNFKSKIWTPQSCQMIHGSSLSKFGVFSPLKIFDENSKNSCSDFYFPDMLAKAATNPMHKYLTSTGKRGFQPFQPVLTPPLSPMDGTEGERNIKLGISESDESKYDNHSFVDSEIVDGSTVVHGGSVYEDLDGTDKDITVVNEAETDHYEYLSDSLQLCQSKIILEADTLPSYLNDKAIPTRPRPISIVLYSDDILRKDKYFNSRFDNLEVYDVSSVQMSPLMEQSLENSSSKTTLSSLSYPHFTRLVSSEDSCAKSPPSADASPSLDNLEISPDDRTFLYNDFYWSNFNSGFDEYETFE